MAEKITGSWIFEALSARSVVSQIQRQIANLGQSNPDLDGTVRRTREPVSAVQKNYPKINHTSPVHRSHFLSHTSLALSRRLPSSASRDHHHLISHATTPGIAIASICRATGPSTLDSMMMMKRSSSAPQPAARRGHRRRASDTPASTGLVVPPPFSCASGTLRRHYSCSSSWGGVPPLSASPEAASTASSAAPTASPATATSPEDVLTPPHFASGTLELISARVGVPLLLGPASVSDWGLSRGAARRVKLLSCCVVVYM